MSAAARLDVRVAPGELAPGELAGRLAVVVDVLRATSTMVQALSAGARAVVPVETLEEAVRVAERLGRPAALLCGERQGVRIDGFELGNSPREFTEARVAGRTLVMTTTNGTLALLAACAAARTLVGSFLNLSAVAEAVHGDARDAVIVCAAREGRFALEDALLAGALALRVRELRGGRLDTDDAGFAAMALARRFEERPALTLANTAAGRRLTAIGLGADVAWCARIDALPVLAELRQRQVVLAEDAAAVRSPGHGEVDA
ncbi:MAG TPA: 2-phosphosulfolactate phosphatase [Longimicrobiales bacterium]|nr:2-phosphosulfolactate phosphatase [Longimicrobiales bacterium]